MINLNKTEQKTEAYTKSSAVFPIPDIPNKQREKQATPPARQLKKKKQIPKPKVKKHQVDEELLKDMLRRHTYDKTEQRELLK